MLGKHGASVLLTLRVRMVITRSVMTTLVNTVAVGSGLNEDACCQFRRVVCSILRRRVPAWRIAPHFSKKQDRNAEDAEKRTDLPCFSASSALSAFLSNCRR